MLVKVIRDSCLSLENKMAEILAYGYWSEHLFIVVLNAKRLGSMKNEKVN
jgi:hypothetical protein